MNYIKKEIEKDVGVRVGGLARLLRKKLYWDRANVRAFIFRHTVWTRLKGQMTVEAKRGKIIPKNINIYKI